MTMAKAAKAKTKTAKTKKTTKAKKSAPKTAAGAKIPMHKVLLFVRMLHDRKRAAKFIAHAKKTGASITLPPKGAKAIGNFMQTHNLTAQSADVCPDGDPFKCR
jgi:hypothetical protein